MTFADLLPGNGADCSFESVLERVPYIRESWPKLVIVVVCSPLADYLALLFN